MALDRGDSFGHVVLIHGLWMRGFTLTSLRRRLEQARFSVDLFDYASVMQDSSASIEKLLAQTAQAKSKKVHFVGHSLGGLLALQTLQHKPELIDGRVVCLGSPLRGSSVARALASFPGGSFLLGRSSQTLSKGLDRWSGQQEVGAIAGRLPLGLGLALGALAAPHDGTVSVEETQLPGLNDHCVVAATHTGLPFSDEAAQQTIAFLRDGRFKHAA
jgi:pimeloyl-ACP methyl ester carboxylesterase